MLGYNFRISDLHAAIGLAQTDRLEQFTKARKANAAFLNSHITHVKTPYVQPGYDHVWHQYTVRVKKGDDRDAAIKKLTEAGIGTGVFYPIPAYRQAHLVELGYGNLSLPVTERLVNEVFSLPVHPLLSQMDLETIVDRVNEL